MKPYEYRSSPLQQALQQNGLDVSHQDLSDQIPLPGNDPGGFWYHVYSMIRIGMLVNRESLGSSNDALYDDTLGYLVVQTPFENARQDIKWHLLLQHRVVCTRLDQWDYQHDIALDRAVVAVFVRPPFWKNAIERCILHFADRTRLLFGW